MGLQVQIRYPRWQTVAAYTYLIICLYDFVVVPVWIGLVRYDVKDRFDNLKEYSVEVQMRLIDAYTFQHQPFTLMGGGLFHLAFGGILTGSTMMDTRNKQKEKLNEN